MAYAGSDLFGDAGGGFEPATPATASDASSGGWFALLGSVLLNSVSGSVVHFVVVLLVLLAALTVMLYFTFQLAMAIFGTVVSAVQGDPISVVVLFLLALLILCVYHTCAADDGEERFQSFWTATNALSRCVGQGHGGPRRTRRLRRRCPRSSSAAPFSCTPRPLPGSPSAPSASPSRLLLCILSFLPLFPPQLDGRAV